MHNKNNHIITHEQECTLLDCYRIALDFGIPAALRAFERLDTQDPIEPIDIAITDVRTGDT